MVISYFGGGFLKIQVGDLILAVDPIGKDSTLKTSRFGADIVLVSLNHEDMNGVEQVTFGEKIPYVVRGPGEYETKEVFIKGFGSSSNYGGEARQNTIYAVQMEGINLCFLGGLDKTDLPADVREALDEVDILFTPVGGKGVLAASEADRLSVALEPKIIIPILYDAGTLKMFLKETGAEGTAPIEKLVVKHKDLEGKEGEVAVLAS
jgi:L-ascorbate metabolism protein UlaG (beta-lactamase superfamily)